MAVETVAASSDVDGVPFIRTRSPRGPHPEGQILMATYQPRPRSELPERFALQVRDDAMVPLARSGDLIWVSSVLEPEPGHCVVIGTDFGGELRQFEPRQDAPPMFCALNPEYEHVDATAERVWVTGVVIAVVPAATQEVTRG